MNEESVEVESSTKKPILTDHDVQLLSKGAELIAGKVSSDFPNELPDLIVLPDSSARPLMYLFRPIFKKIAKDRGVTSPQYVFYQTPSGAQKTALRTVNDFGSTEDAMKFVQSDIVLDQKNTTFLHRFTNRELYKQKKRDIKFKREVAKEIDNVPQILKQQENRTDEIVNICNSKHPRIIIIDETMISSGRTMTMIQRSFQKRTGSDTRGYVLTAWEPKAGNVFAAQEIDVTSADIRDHPFDYMRKVSTHIGSARDAYGVEKQNVLENSYVVPTYTDGPRQRQLRHEMSEIGKEIADKIRN